MFTLLLILFAVTPRSDHPLGRGGNGIEYGIYDILFQMLSRLSPHHGYEVGLRSDRVLGGLIDPVTYRY